MLRWATNCSTDGVILRPLDKQPLLLHYRRHLATAVMRRALAVCCASSAAALDSVSGRLLRRVKRVDAGGDAYRSARDFVLNGEALGKVLPRAADALKPFFTVTDDAVALDADDATAVLKDAFDALRREIMVRTYTRDSTEHTAAACMCACVHAHVPACTHACLCLTCVCACVRERVCASAVASVLSSSLSVGDGVLKTRT